MKRFPKYIPVNKEARTKDNTGLTQARYEQLNAETNAHRNIYSQYTK